VRADARDARPRTAVTPIFPRLKKEIDAAPRPFFFAAIPEPALSSKPPFKAIQQIVESDNIVETGH